MKSFATRRFWTTFDELPNTEKNKAKKQYHIWMKNPFYPSLHFKKVGGSVWSARVSEEYRALALEKHGDFYWFWIGTHREYEKTIRRK